MPHAAESPPAPAALRALVRAAARAELLPRYADVVRHLKTDGSPVTEADHAMQARMQRALARRWPQYGFLGEGMTGHEHAQLAAGAPDLWCLDPLGGTGNFTAGVPFFAVSLALLVAGRPELGLVCDPVRDECFCAARGRGARRNDAPLAGPGPVLGELRRVIACVDFKRLDKSLAARLAAEPPYGSQRNFGASSLEWCWLADGRFHLYLHGGQQLWDYAAGSLILSEAGGHSATLDGQEVFAFGLAPRSVVAARDARLFAAWQAWLRARRDAAPPNPLRLSAP